MNAGENFNEGYKTIPLGRTEFSESGSELRVVSLGQIINKAMASRATDEAEMEFARAFGMTPCEVFKRFDSDELAPGYKAIILPIAKRKFWAIYNGFFAQGEPKQKSSSQSIEYAVTV